MNVVETKADGPARQAILELVDLELALLGGGICEVVVG
jgi:hypothetical protein